MLGINAQTGQPLAGIDHLRQSIRDILTTRIGMQPLFRIYAGSQEITAAIRDQLIELVVTDEGGIQSDELKLTLDDRRREDGAIAELPRIGTVLTVSLGYAETQLVSMGRFIVDEVEIRSPAR